MTAYRAKLRPAAIRALQKIDPAARTRIQGAIALLAQNPRPPSSRPLTGRAAMRVRVGDHRIIYAIHDGVLLVVVVTIRHRREEYQQ